MDEQRLYSSLRNQTGKKWRTQPWKWPTAANVSNGQF
jgi:hypothetical protein